MPRTIKFLISLSYLQNETNLKRQTILEILLRSEQVVASKIIRKSSLIRPRASFDPQCRVLSWMALSIKKLATRHSMLNYGKRRADRLSRQNMLEAEKSVYDHVIYNSETVEADLAQAFEKNEQVKVYAKLPSWFKVDTPLGSSDPDWAVLFDIDGRNVSPFVVESKETHIEELLRKEAQGKIKCGRAHFEALGADTNYVVASNMDTLMDLDGEVGAERINNEKSQI